MSSGEKRAWADLLPDILDQIVSHLPLSDVPYFAAVCKAWRYASPVVYPADYCPLLMHYIPSEVEAGFCRFYCPPINKIFRVPCRDCDVLYGTKPWYSKDGWLLVTQGSLTYKCILANAMAGIWFPVPEFTTDTSIPLNSMAFSHPPRSSDQIGDTMIFGITTGLQFSIYVCLYREGAWSETYYDNQMFMVSNSSPVWRHNRFYCLALDGILGVYEPQTNKWQVLNKQRKMKFDKETTIHLVGTDNDDEQLMLAIIEQGARRVQLMRLDESKMIWKKIANIDNCQSIFVGWPHSFATSTMFAPTRNKLQLNRIREAPLIHAEVKNSEKRFFFVPKDQSIKLVHEDGMQHYTLHNDEHRRLGFLTPFVRQKKQQQQHHKYDPVGFLYSIWFQV